MSQPTLNDAGSPPVEKITRGDALAQGQDTAAENRRKLMELFPGVLTETEAGLAVDAAALAGYVGAVADDDRRERFGLAWHGKAAARRLALTPSAGTLRPAADQSVDFDTTRNVLIEGDNLEALKLLQKAYSGKVKLIYIDPPYNTGNDFVYKDDFRDPIGQYKRTVGDADEAGAALTSNTDSGGRFHTTWLNMIYPRLLLARELLRQEGSIFISIDEAELPRLRQLMDEIFGDENFIVQIVWRKRNTPPNDRVIGTNHDYILCFARSESDAALNLRTRSEEQTARYSNPDNDSRGDWAPGDLSANVKGGRYVESLNYPIVNPATGQEHLPGERGNWRFSRTRVAELIADARITFGSDGRSRPKLKRFLAEAKDGVSYPTWWDFVPLNTSGSAEMNELLGSSTAFESPKPVGLIREIVSLGSKDGDLILDFFAGSGTTGHAVMAQNAADAGNRKFVLVQLPEPTGRAEYPTIADLTAERLRRAGAKIKAEHEGTLAGTASAADGTAGGGGAAGLDTGFRVFKLDSANVKAWETPTTDTLTGESAAQLIGESVDAVKPDRTPADLLWGAMLNLGLPLDGRVETRVVAGKSVYVAGGGTLMACFDAAIDLPAGESLAIGLAGLAAERQVTGELTVLLLDKAFGGHDAAKVNLVENLKQRVPVSVTGVRVRSI